MRKSVLCAAGALILGFAAGWVSAQEQDDANRGGDKKTTSAVGQNLAQEPNGQTSDVNQQEVQSHQQMRDMIRQRAQERRQQMQQGRDAMRAGNRARPGMLADANTPAAVKYKGEPNAKDQRKPVEQGVTRSVNPQQRLAVLEQQISYEEAKHMDRLARLSRIRELAQQQGNTETVGRVDKLLEEEQQLYDAKTRRMEHRRNIIVEPSEKTSPDKGLSRRRAEPDRKGIGAGRNRDGNQPPAENR